MIDRDTTYIPIKKGFVYLTAVIDVASRRMHAHKTATTLEACHAVEIIERAFAKFGTPEIVNTDQGSQFTNAEFKTLSNSLVEARLKRCFQFAAKTSLWTEGFDVAIVCSPRN